MNDEVSFLINKPVLASYPKTIPFSIKSGRDGNTHRMYICIYICNLLIGNFAGNGNFHHLRASRLLYVDNMCICSYNCNFNITGGYNRISRRLYKL